MSLKAKLEAVIYAAEEPVTLAQLAALFTADALEWKAEQAAASAAPAPEPASETPEAGQPLPPVNQEFLYMEEDRAAAVSTAPDPSAQTQEPAAEPEPESTPASMPETSVEAGTESNPETLLPAGADSAPSAEDAAAVELELRRQARLRDREAREVIRQLIGELIASYASDGRGVEIREIAGGYRMATKPECHDAVRSFVKSLKPPLKLSLPALETLAVIAYKQPVTSPEVNEIRGVDSSAVFGSLLARKLIATAGRKPVIGRPILYKTTREFLLRFGLKDVSELPSMEEFEKLAASELDETELSSGAEVAAPEDSDENLELILEMEPDGNHDGDQTLLSEPEFPQPAQTAGTAAGNKSQPAEVAPAAPRPTEQAETETFPHDEENQKAR